VFARIARFEGVAPEGIDAMVQQMQEEAAAGPPPGLEDATAFWMLVDRERGTGLGIVLFPDEEGLRRGDEALNEMNPGEGGGRRSAVEVYEVVLRQELD
jgi:hypothetical protein